MATTTKEREMQQLSEGVRVRMREGCAGYFPGEGTIVDAPGCGPVRPGVYVRVQWDHMPAGVVGRPLAEKLELARARLRSRGRR
jgi:hypothetical protein